MAWLRYSWFLVAIVVVAGCKDQTSATDYNDQPDTAVVPADNLPARIDAAIDYTSNQRLMNTRDQAAWQIVHGLEAFGRDLKIEADGQQVGRWTTFSRETRSRAGTCARRQGGHRDPRGRQQDRRRASRSMARLPIAVRRAG